MVDDRHEPSGDDARDEDLAARLAVEPLDELTRRRLVTTAMAAAEVDATADAPAMDTPAPATSSNRLRWLVAAAAALLVVVVGSVAVLRNGESNDPTVASRDATAVSGQANENSKAAESAPNTDTPRSAGAAPASTGLGVTLGEFGDVSKAKERKRLLAAIDDAALKAPDEDSAASAGYAGSSPCPSGNLAPVLATATATYEGRPAQVVVTEQGGTRHVLLVISDPCEVRQLR